MTAVSAEDWNRGAMRTAVGRFSEHCLVEHRQIGPADIRWRLARRGGNDGWYEVTLRAGQLLVGGDIRPIGFEGYTPPVGSAAPIDYVRWIGTKTCDPHYAAGKAERWWGDAAPFTRLRPDVALYDLGVWCRSLDDQIAPPAEGADLLAVVRDAVREIDDGADVEDVLDALPKALRDDWNEQPLDRALLRDAMARLANSDDVRPVIDELIAESSSGAFDDMGRVGEVYSPRLIFGVAAVAHLHHLVSGETIETSTDPIVNDGACV